MRALLLLLAVCTACSTDPADDHGWDDGKGDGFGADRQIEVLFNEPFCDVCTAADKARVRSQMEAEAAKIQR